jgi:hypothetical protein
MSGKADWAPQMDAMMVVITLQRTKYLVITNHARIVADSLAIDAASRIKPRSAFLAI